MLISKINVIKFEVDIICNGAVDTNDDNAEYGEIMGECNDY